MGKLFSVAYIDDGNWHLLVFSYETVIVDLHINNTFGIDNSTIPLAGFFHPFAACTFIQNDQIIYSFFYRKNRMHYHFVYDPFTRQVVGKLQNRQMTNCTMKNFPLKSFYDPKLNLAFVFYRQGNALTISTEHIEKFQKEKITDFDLGELFIWKDKVLIARSSQQILFFKYDFDEEMEVNRWINYHSFESRGFISGNKRHNMFQVIEDQYIYFYEINEADLIPRRVNCMLNFMKCGMMSFGEAQRYCIAYKTGQENFTLYSRKMQHDFKTIVNNQNFENAHGISVDKDENFIVARDGKITLYENKMYEEKFTLDLNLPQSDTREPLEIISICVNKDSTYIALFVGKQLIKDEELILTLVILKRGLSQNYEILKKIDMEEQGMSGVCKRLYFDNYSSDNLIVVSEDKILKLNFI